jgi:hypothetical protein
MSSTPNYRLPVKREVPPMPAVPLWQQAAPAVVRGAALVAAGVIAEWMLRAAAKRATSMSLRPFRVKKPRSRGPAHTPATVAYTETVVFQRTVVRRD